MNSKERLFFRLEGRPVDRIPNLNILMLFAAREIGVPFREYCLDYRHLVRGNIACAEKYGRDCVTTMSDSMRETSGMGMEVVYPEDDVPYGLPLVREYSDLKRLRAVDPSSSPRMADSVHAVEMYREEQGDEMPVIGWVEGCMAESANLRGMDRLLMDLIEEPEFVVDLMELSLEQEIRFARAQVVAGADIIGVGDAIASVAGPHFYREFALPYQIRLLSAIRDMGAKTKLHICGNITPFLELLPAEYCDIIDVDWMVPLGRVLDLYGGRCAVSGNYDPVNILLQGSLGQVRDAVWSCAGNGGSRYISSAGCEVPKNTPPENLMEVLASLQDFGYTGR